MGVPFKCKQENVFGFNLFSPRHEPIINDPLKYVFTPPRLPLLPGLSAIVRFTEIKRFPFSKEVFSEQEQTQEGVPCEEDIRSQQYSVTESKQSFFSMEDLEPISEVQQHLFCVELMKRLNMQRRQDYLCDITLVAKEGKEFKAHRNVLSAVSPFFVKLFQSEMKEKEEGIIRFEISASILEGVLEFIYTGHLRILDERNAKDLIIAADFLLLVCLKTFAGRFLEQRLSNSNCISTFYFAEKYQCEELVAKTRKFVHENFASVAELDEFLDLEAEEVERWISIDDICVAAEEDILKIIQKWTEQNESDRKAKFEELFRHVRLVLVSRDVLVVDIVTNQLVRDNYSCLKRVSDAIAFVSCTSEDALMQSPRRRLGTHAIVACGGKHTLCYLPEADTWKFLANGLFENMNYRTQLVSFRDQLFTFDGSCNTHRYDPAFDAWSSLQRLRLSSNSKRVAVIRGQIYAIDVEGIIERYNMGSWSWESIFRPSFWERVRKSHRGCRKDSCIVVAGDCLYVLGGKSELQQQSTRGFWRPAEFICVTKAERFHTVHKKWKEIADMKQERSCAFGVATQGKIFVAGGEGRENKQLNSCEVYTISTNEWQFIGSLNVPRLWGSMVCVNGTLYVLGGSQKYQGFEYTVESYDPTVKRWTQRASIPVDKIPGNTKPSFKGCALKIPKVVLAKLK